MRRTAAFVALALPFAGTLLFVAYQLALARQWVPDRAGETILFLNYRMPHPLQSYEILAAVEIFWSVAFLAAVTYAGDLRRALGRSFLVAVVAAQAACLAVMIASPFPMDADQFAYVYYGDLTQRHLNPYPAYAAPLRLQGEETRVAVHWNNPPYVDRYGAAWSLGNAAALLPVRNLSAEVQARWLRVLASAAAIACTLLLTLLLPDVPWRDRAIVAAALNPLAIAAAGNGGHNDWFLVLFGLLAWLAARARRFELSAVALATAVCIKFAYAPLLPALLAFAYVATRSWLRMATTAAVFSATVVAYSMPLGIGTSLVAPVFGWNAQRMPAITYWLWRAVYHIPHLHWVPLRPFGLIVPLAVAGCGLALAVAALRRRRLPPVELALAALVLMLPYKIESWYGVMITPVLLTPVPLAPVFYMAVTLACQFLQMRIFYASSHPYVTFVSLAVLLAVVLYEWWYPRPAAAVEAPRRA